MSNVHINQYRKRLYIRHTADVRIIQKMIYCSEGVQKRSGNNNALEAVPMLMQNRVIDARIVLCDITLNI